MIVVFAPSPHPFGFTQCACLYAKEKISAVEESGFDLTSNVFLNLSDYFVETLVSPR